MGEEQEDIGQQDYERRKSAHRLYGSHDELHVATMFRRNVPSQWNRHNPQPVPRAFRREDGKPVEELRELYAYHWENLRSKLEEYGFTYLKEMERHLIELRREREEWVEASYDQILSETDPEETTEQEENDFMNWFRGRIYDTNPAQDDPPELYKRMSESGRRHVVERRRQIQRADDALDGITYRLHMLRTILYQEAVFGWVRRWNQSDTAQHIEIAIQEVNITGRAAQEYAVDARDLLDKFSHISTFSKLAAKMESEDVNGDSVVDTLKRGTGYEDLPSEKKDFSVFKEMLRNGVSRLEDESPETT